MCFRELSVIGEMFNACSGWGVCACGFIGDADRFIRLMLFSFICMLVCVCVLVCSGVIGLGVYGFWEGFMLDVCVLLVYLYFFFFFYMYFWCM